MFSRKKEVYVREKTVATGITIDKEAHALLSYMKEGGENAGEKWLTRLNSMYTKDTVRRIMQLAQEKAKAG